MSRSSQVELLLAGLRNSSNEPLSGGLVYSYEAGTTTPKALYTTQDKGTSATNPVVLDANGVALVFADGAYKFIVKDADGVTLYTWDDLQFVYPENLPVYAGTATGSSGAYAVTPSPAVASLTDGLQITFIANHTNGGAATLNVSALGATAIVTAAGAALSGSEIPSGGLINTIYVAGSSHFRLISTVGTLAINAGGTGAATVAGARTNFGIGTGDSPTFTGATLSGLTASLPVFTDGSKALASKSVADTLTALGLSSASDVTFDSYGGSFEVLASAGTNQATAAAITKQTTGVTGTAGVILPACATWGAGRPLILITGSTGSINVYPAVGEAIVYGVSYGANTPIPMTAASAAPPAMVMLVNDGSSTWWAIGT